VTPAAIHQPCTSTPCANTASGKDPQEEAIEEGQRMTDALRASDEVRERWSVPIYSDSTRLDDLTLDVWRSPAMIRTTWTATGCSPMPDLLPHSSTSEQFLASFR